MCLAHWRRVSKINQKAVWAHYRPGQCDDKRPSQQWTDAAREAIEEVATKEGVCWIYPLDCEGVCGSCQKSLRNS